MVLELLFEYGEHESNSVSQIANVIQILLRINLSSLFEPKDIINMFLTSQSFLCFLLGFMTLAPGHKFECKKSV